MKKSYQRIIKVMFILTIGLLLGCTNENNFAPSINGNDIDFNFIHDVDSNNDTISYTLKDNESTVVLSLPEGASIHTWLISDKTTGMKLIDQERVIIKDKKNIEGKSPYQQEFTFKVEDSASKTIVMKKVNLLDLENEEEHNYKQVDPVFELSIQIK